MKLLLLFLTLIVTAKPVSAQCFMETESGIIDLSHLCNQKQPSRQQSSVEGPNEPEYYQEYPESVEEFPEYIEYSHRLDSSMWFQIRKEQQERIDARKVGFDNGLPYYRIREIIGFEGELVYEGQNSDRWRW